MYHAPTFDLIIHANDELHSCTAFDTLLAIVRSGDMVAQGVTAAANGTGGVDMDAAPRHRQSLQHEATFGIGHRAAACRDRARRRYGERVRLDTHTAKRRSACVEQATLDPPGGF